MKVFLEGQPHEYGLIRVSVQISKLILEMVFYFAYQTNRLYSLVIDQ
jgi:hypothetical protein